MVVFIKLFDDRWRVFCFEDRKECSGQEIKDMVMETEGLSSDSFLLHNGRVLKSDTVLSLDQGDRLVYCYGRLVGGKGGFGSMLRAIGAQIEKTTNREACRDLSGRRMRDVNDEKKIADWLAKQSDKEQEKARLKQKRLEKLASTPRHVFEDSSVYTSQLQENIDSVEDALQKGLKSGTESPSSSSLGKRKASEKTKKTHSKKQKLWLGIGEDLSSDSDNESDIGSSCSSVAEGHNLGSECSSGISSSVLGQSSEAELSDSQENPRSSETHKEQCCLTSERTSCATSTTSSVPSSSGDTDNERCATKLKNIEEYQNIGHEEEKVAVVDFNETKSNIEEKKPTSSVSLPLDLDNYQSKEELEVLGLDVLKSALIALGLKCGGTLQQRAERLFSTKGIPHDKLDRSLLAKPSAKKAEKKKGKSTASD